MSQHLQEPAPEQDKDQSLVAFLTWFDRVMDRLILLSLPVVILALVLWAFAAALPFLAVALNLAITLLVLFVTIIVELRLVEIAWRWFTHDDPEDILNLPQFGAFGAAILVVAGVACLIPTIIQAGQASEARTTLIVSLLLVLVLQYRAILVRRLRPQLKKD